MTTPLTKLIEENKWRPIEEAPTPNVDLLCRCDDSLELLRYVEKNHMRNNESGWFEAYSLRGKYNPTHFRPLPDDRLALVTEVLLDAMKLHDHMNWVSADLQRATEIATGGEKQHG